MDYEQELRQWAEQAAAALGVPVDVAYRAAVTAMNSYREPLRSFGVILPPKPRWWRWRQRRRWREEAQRRLQPPTARGTTASRAPHGGG